MFRFYMDTYLSRKNYANMSLEEVPIEEIVNAINEYLKIQLEKETPVDTILLFQEYENMLKSLQKPKDINAIIYFLLEYISALQHFAVLWQVNNTEEPIITYNETYPDKIDSLYTKETVDYQKTFELLLNTALDLKKDNSYTR